MLSSLQIEQDKLSASMNYKKNRKYKDGYDQIGFIENLGFFFI